MSKNTKRLISALICLTLVLAALPLAASAADTTTVYYYNSSNWSKVCVYWWGSSDSNPSWPGNDMTDLGNGYWSYDVPSDIAGKSGVGGIIFNVGSDAQKTTDLVLPTDDKNCFAGNEWVVYTGAQIEVVVDYYLRGDMNGWDTSNVMTKNSDGTYSITVTLAAGEYQYKLGTADWTTSFPAQNATLTVEQDGEVTFVLNPETGEITVNGETPEQPSVVPPADITGEYRVAGNTEWLGNWDAGNSVGLMTETASGIYEITFANVAAGSYAFKITRNGDWEQSWGDNGGDVQVEVTATSDLTVTFDANTGVVSYEVTPVETNTPSDPSDSTDSTDSTGSTAAPSEPAVDVSGDYRVVGSAQWMGEWDPANSVGLMDEIASGVYEITFADVAVGTYEFKVSKNGTWDENWGKDGFNSDNVALEVTVAGDVTVKFDANTGIISYQTASDDAEVPVNPDTPEEDTPIVDDTPDTAIVTAVVPADWTNPCIWAWGTNGNAFETWPGQAMTKDGDVFTAVVPSWVENVIINNGVAEGAVQTVDIPVPAGKDVTITLTTAGDDGKYAATVDGAAPVEPPKDVSGVYRVVGTLIESWDADNDAGLMTEAGAGVYEVTLKDVQVGEYEFKITKNGSWAENWGKDGFNTDNIVVNVTVAGDVTVVFDANCEAIRYKTAASEEFVPVTGDVSLVAVCAALLAASAGLVCVVSKKKEF